MKIAASDFDGTLYTRQDKVSAANLAAIRRWREAGHSFGIVTGRDRALLLHSMQHYDVPVDFLICNNGAAIFDRELRCIYSDCLDEAVLRDFIVDDCLNVSQHRILSTPEETVAFAVQENSWIHRENFAVRVIDEAAARRKKQVTQVTLSFATAAEARVCANEIERRYGGALLPQQNAAALDVTPPGVNKSTGIQHLLRIRQWEGAEVFAIGDESNDLAMLRDFRGFTVATARDEIKREARGVYQSVAEMLLDQLG